MKLKTGTPAPDFSLPDQNGKTHALSDYKGKWLVVYFYPKDDTPGCTLEACNFRDNHSALAKLGAEVVGVSTDPVASHKKFEEKYELNFALLADENQEMVNAYDVWGLKKFMGKEYEGTSRVSFIIDPDGKIAKIYEKVKAAEHGEEVLSDLKALIGS